jgi:phosphate transport system substrate-binding protein
MDSQSRRSSRFGFGAALLTAATFAGTGAAHAQAARDYISIVGSSTVYPFATVVAEQFGRTSKFKTPKIESTGSGGGLKLFCNGVGVQHPDIANASRAIAQSEIDTCAKNGVKEIVEVRIGYDGIVVANAKSTPRLNLSLKDLYLALAKNVPDPAGGSKLVPNPYKTWQQVNSKLPADKIEVLGPPPTSGTRDAFVELVMEPGAKTFPALAALDKDAFTAASHTLREDGAYIEAGENDNLIVQKLEANKHQLGIFGYSYLQENEDKIQGSQINGIAPEFEAIAAAQYPISRPLFFYVKKAHVGVIPGIKEYIAEFTSDKALGENGYLSDKGLIPLSDKDRKAVAAASKALTTMTAGAAH